ncbi:SDR family oxidoreductase [Streptomyces decoyicus]|uniref:SDR family oxidoreductase n=1 Tax=Streptomyces decoyicus TaxID=249567 RepID=UPI003628B901
MSPERPQRPQPLSGRLAVVTGAARGLGACMVRALVRRGATVALIGLEEAELKRVTASFPGRAHHWCADITDEAVLTETAARVQRQLGPPSVVIANAGVAAVGSFLQSDADTWRRVVEVNLIGSSLTARAFLPGLLTTRGYYMQVASLASITAAPMMSAYCASKSGVEAFAHALRAEVAHRGVDVGIAYLSWADTEMINAAVLRELRAHLPWPAGKVYRPQAVADRLVRGVERRAPALYAQPWLRAAQVIRAGLPAVVTRWFRDELPRLEHQGDYEDSGLIGKGGRAATR